MSLGSSAFSYLWRQSAQGLGSIQLCVLTVPYLGCFQSELGLGAGAVFEPSGEVGPSRWAELLLIR